MNKKEAIEKIKNIDTLNIYDKVAGQQVDMVIKNEVLDIISQIDEPVEKEKLYTVEIPNPNNTSPKYKLMLVKGTNGVEILRDYYNEKRDPYFFQLTESEIKQDFEWAWKWAKEVE